MTLSGSPFDYVIAFLGGILVSFTPCIYPLIPISAGYIGITAAGSRVRGLFLSLFYVTGVALTYSLLGLIASLSGTVFGKISTSPLTYLIAGIVIILFGLSMLDLFMFPVFNLIKAPALKKKGYWPVFLLGLSSGLMVSPCLTPVLGSILVYIATKKNPIYGTTLLFVFAYGMGLVLILIGTFSAALVSLPKSGRWLTYIKKALSFILIAIGVYFIYKGLRRF